MRSRRWQTTAVATITVVVMMTLCVATASPGTHHAVVKSGDVTDTRIVSGTSSGRNWLVLGGDFGSRHYSPLRQINARNVARMGLAWALDIDSPMGLATEPIVVDGTIYATASLDRIYAIDAASGRLLWQFDPHVRLSVMRNSWAARTNRGVAVYRGKVYFGSGDCRLFALDAATGKGLWNSPVCVDTTQTGITGAPTVGDGKVYIGYNGSDTGVRGSLVAFDADTGKLAWRFWNVPGDPSNGFESKALRMAAHHYQTSIESENFHVLVTDLALRGVKRRVVMTVPRNGTFFLLDAKTGKLIAKKDLATAHTPQPSHVARATVQRSRSGHNWWPMSYDPGTRLVYIPTYDDVARPTGYQNQATGRLIAWDPATESARWTVPQQLSTNSGVLSTAGNLVFQGQGTGEFDAYSADRGRKLWSVATGSAIDSVPVTYMVGHAQYVLMPVGLGSASRMFGPVSTMATPESKLGPSRLLAFRLGGTMPLPYPHAIILRVPRPPEQTADAATIARGQKVFYKFMCDDCHSPEADGSGQWRLNGTIPDLRYMPADVHDQFLAIVLGGTHRANGMPGFGTGAGFPLVHTRMSVADALALHAYLIELEWQAFRNDR